MKDNVTAKTITIRLSPNDYVNATRLAKSKNLSINKLFIDGLNQLAHQEQERKLLEDFTLIGDQIREASVEFGLAAQAEMVEKS